MHAGVLVHVPEHERRQQLPIPSALFHQRFVPHRVRQLPVASRYLQRQLDPNTAQLLPLLHVRKQQLRRRDQRGHLHERRVQKYASVLF